jgi:hypothetical protein
VISFGAVKEFQVSYPHPFRLTEGMPLADIFLVNRLFARSISLAIKVPVGENPMDLNQELKKPYHFNGI